MTATATFILNGLERRTAADGRSLLVALRDEFGLRSARFGCGQEACGACMVLVDGEPAYSCGRDLASVDGRIVTTPEGIDPARMDALVDAFVDEQAGQCGYCLSGILVSAAALLARSPDPSRAEIVAALDPHLCRCGAHTRILRAVETAARRLAAAP